MTCSQVFSVIVGLVCFGLSAFFVIHPAVASLLLKSSFLHFSHYHFDHVWVCWLQVPRFIIIALNTLKNSGLIPRVWLCGASSMVQLDLLLLSLPSFLLSPGQCAVFQSFVSLNILLSYLSHTLYNFCFSSFVQAIAFHCLMVLSSIGMEVVNSYSYAEFRISHDDSLFPFFIIGFPAFSIAAFIAMLVVSVCTYVQKKRIDRFFEV